MRVRVHAFLFALTVSSALTLAAPQPPKVPLDVVLDRAGWYLDYFVDEFENVVAEETYTQDSSQLLASFSPAAGGRGGAAPPPPPSDMLRARHRDLRSDFLLVKSPDTAALVPFRDVIQVDGIVVRDREARLGKLFLTATTDAMGRSTTFAPRVYRNTRATSQNPTAAHLEPSRRLEMADAVAPEVMSTSTPVAYAPAWASTSARKMTVIAADTAVNTRTRGRAARVHSGAMPYRGRYLGTRLMRPAIALAPANQRITTVLMS